MTRDLFPTRDHRLGALSVIDILLRILPLEEGSTGRVSKIVNLDDVVVELDRIRRTCLEDVREEFDELTRSETRAHRR